MNDRPDIHRSLRWLMILRVVVATTLMLSAFLIELTFRPALTLKPFYYLTGATYLLTLVYALGYLRFRSRAGFAYLQVVGDILLVTGLVYITGGVGSAFSFLYILTIITASIILFRRGAWIAAASSWVAYAMLVLLRYEGLLPGYPGPAPVPPGDKQLTYALVAHLLGFLAVAYLSSALTEKLRQTGAELAERQEDLAALQVLHRNIIDSIHSGIVTTDTEGDVTFVNHAAEAITGYTLASQLGRPVHGLLGESPDFLREVSSKLVDRPRHRFERRYTNARGEHLFLGMAVQVLRDRAGAARGYIFIFQDLTEIRALEEELRLKDQMSVLGRMAAGMAHELRNPLASMSGSIRILKSELDLDRSQEDLMKVVLAESRRLDDTIRDFLLFARPGRFQPDDGDLARVLSESLVLLRNSDELREDHRIETDFRPASIPYRFDENQMKQIFWNLAKNSLRAMPEGGRLLIRIRVPAGEGPEISFQDEGIGMEPSEIQRFIQPFETQFPEGTGLGLAIVYRNVQQLGGKLHVDSRPGAGSCFTIRLPAQTVEARATA
ncbi:MAG: ATP-binding protein [Acidobacteriota bacterium]|jgi:two-component system sensor histidine kinase PilS (NtrC family)